MPEGHACHQGTQSGNPKHLDLEPGPFQAGGQAPPIHRVTKSQQGEFNGIPGRAEELRNVALIAFPWP